MLDTGAVDPTHHAVAEVGPAVSRVVVLEPRAGEIAVREACGGEDEGPAHGQATAEAQRRDRVELGLDVDVVRVAVILGDAREVVVEFDAEDAGAGLPVASGLDAEDHSVATQVLRTAEPVVVLVVDAEGVNGVADVAAEVEAVEVFPLVCRGEAHGDESHQCNQGELLCTHRSFSSWARSWRSGPAWFRCVFELACLCSKHHETVPKVQSTSPGQRPAR